MVSGSGQQITDTDHRSLIKIYTNNVTGSKKRFLKGVVVKKFQHGGNLYSIARERGVSADELIDFSANINPLGPPASVIRAIRESVHYIVHYPETPPAELINAATGFYGVSEKQIVFGNGSTELLYIIPKIVDKKKAVIVVPSYVDYEKVCILNGLDIDFFYLKEEDKFELDFKELSSFLDIPSIVFIGQPNNPTGKVFDPKSIREIAISHPDSIFVIDEAFADFVDGLDRMYINRPKNVIVLLSLTKFFSIPGIRLGLMIADESIIAKMKQYLPPWSVNSIAYRIGINIFQEKDYIYQSRKYVFEQKKFVFNELKQIPGLCAFESDVNFILVKVTSQDIDVSFLKKTLLEKKIVIRDCSNYRGLNNRFFRIAVKSKEENLYLLECLKEIFLHGETKKEKTYYPVGPYSSTKTPAIMFVGTSSNAGKSILAAGLCRILYNEGFKVAPFKAQNMSLNSYVTKDGGEMGRAQVLQAQACRLDPDVRMNPVLLKPSTDTGSQVIVLGRPVANMEVKDYFEYKRKLLDVVRQTYDSIASEFDVIVLEGAGSPAEINLKPHDITNMQMAKYARANTFLVGDIDRGGVFASFIGTMDLLDKWEQDLIKGFIINKFRGDASLLDPAIDVIEKYTGKPFLGIVPYIKNLGLPEEDSVSFKMGWDKIQKKSNAPVKIACIDLPHISNFTDLDPFLSEPDVSITIIKTKSDLLKEQFDLIIIPGSKNVIKDNEYLKKSSIAETIKYIIDNKNTQLIGICGGFQIIGEKISDPYNIESSKVHTDGLAFIPIITELDREKTLIQTHAVHIPSNLSLTGYEIHHGRTFCTNPEDTVCVVKNKRGDEIGYGTKDLKIWGSYLHGIFDDDVFRRWLIDEIRISKGLSPLKTPQTNYSVEQGLNQLAEVLKNSLDMEKIFKFIEK